jgi:hypothetical protein
VLLGDRNGNGAIDTGETTLLVPKTAAIQIINSSQTANDTRQILMSQAEGAQLNINSGDVDSGIKSVSVDLITDAVYWLEGKSPFIYGAAGGTGNVDQTP